MGLWCLGTHDPSCRRAHQLRHMGTQGPGCHLFWFFKKSQINPQIWTPAHRVESKPNPLNLAFKALCGLAPSYLPTLTAHDAPT